MLPVCVAAQIAAVAAIPSTERDEWWPVAALTCAASLLVRLRLALASWSIALSVHGEGIILGSGTFMPRLPSGTDSSKADAFGQMVRGALLPPAGGWRCTPWKCPWSSPRAKLATRRTPASHAHF